MPTLFGHCAILNSCHTPTIVELPRTYSGTTVAPTPSIAPPIHVVSPMRQMRPFSARELARELAVGRKFPPGFVHAEKAGVVPEPQRRRAAAVHHDVAHGAVIDLRLAQ